MATIIDGSGITTPEISAGNIVGEICFFGMATPPAGFLKCNGATISRTTYAALFAAIGTTWGGGDGSTTFNLPDYRGEFLRCWDDGRGVDNGRAFGGFQGENWKGFYMTNTQQGLSSGYSHNDVDMGKSTTSYVGKLLTGLGATHLQPSGRGGTPGTRCDLETWRLSPVSNIEGQA